MGIEQIRMARCVGICGNVVFDKNDTVRLGNEKTAWLVKMCLAEGHMFKDVITPRGKLCARFLDLAG